MALFVFLQRDSCARKRQFADAGATRRKDRIGNCRRDRLKRWLAETRRRVVALDEVTFHIRRLVDAQYRVLVEVDLLYCAARNRRLELRRAECVDHTALHLAEGTTHVEDRTDIHRGVHLVQRVPITINSDLGDMRDMLKSKQLEKLESLVARANALQKEAQKLEKMRTAIGQAYGLN